MSTYFFSKMAFGALSDSISCNFHCSRYDKALSSFSLVEIVRFCLVRLLEFSKNSKIQFSLDFEIRMFVFEFEVDLDFRRPLLQPQDVWMVGCWEKLDLGPFPNNQRRNPLGGFCVQLAALGRDLALNSPAGSLGEGIALPFPPTCNRRRARLLDWEDALATCGTAGFPSR